MTDSRAALEERGTIAFRKWKTEGDWADTSGEHTGGQLLADFYEQESSSLKLLLRAMFADQVDYIRWPQPALLFYGEPRKILSFELDSSGIPVITQEIIEALEAAK